MYVILLKVVVDPMDIILEHLFISVCFLWTLSFFEHKFIFVKAIQFRNRKGKRMESVQFSKPSHTIFLRPHIPKYGIFQTHLPITKKCHFREPHLPKMHFRDPHIKNCIFNTSYKNGIYETSHTAFTPRIPHWPKFWPLIQKWPKCWPPHIKMNKICHPIQK